jgi:hypothetical protein
LKEALSSLFLLPSRVLSTGLCCCPRSPSRGLARCSVCFLRGDPDLGLPPAHSFWPGWTPRLPWGPSALGLRFFEGLFSDLSPAGAGNRQR